MNGKKKENGHFFELTDAIIIFFSATCELLKISA